MNDPWLPADFTPVSTVGLVSDTHMPLRLRCWPAGLAEALAGVDLILHAGDVGDLWVLDELSQHGPVVAVHGNDETPEAKLGLPLQSIISLAGQRILLWHGHYPDRIDELTSRTDERLAPKLERLGQRGRRAGARLVVTGHWHIPLIHEAEGVLIVNPGALGTGNAISRQLFQTVARLYIGPNGEIAIVHLDLARLDQPHGLLFDPTLSFSENAAFYNDTILAPELQPLVPRFFKEVWAQAPDAMYRISLELAWQVWDGDRAEITLADWQAGVRSYAGLSEPVRADLLARLAALAA
ncbi:MAG: metallophosphoesterase family protein [Anaerolineales bacterium]|nr:metallophosphoesterase family protein [Anaerolineales bacterium]MCB0010900.1 metallophosphoesterase family protein [Anaerolineales bacterium]MCB0030110.1 metallophosphoesterase family protein [Anaerolineales bacterium]MCB8962771.1 metallophosphoesterase family protein [Ardenticatenales bacterium]